MRELTPDEITIVSGGHGFTDGGIVSAMLIGMGVGGSFGGPVGAYVGGIAAGVGYMVYHYMPLNSGLTSHGGSRAAMERRLTNSH